MQTENLLGTTSCPALLNKRQMAARYGVSVSCINKWMGRGLPYMRLRYKTVRFNPVLCDAALCQNAPSFPAVIHRRRKKRRIAEDHWVQLGLPLSDREELFLWPTVDDQPAIRAA